MSAVFWEPETHSDRSFAQNRGTIMTSCKAKWFLAMLLLALPAAGQTLKVLHAFAGTDGEFPNGGLLRDSAGNLYGSTFGGGDLNCYNGISGSPGCGTVFKLDVHGIETVLYAFDGGGDGSGPSHLLRDKAGNLYGTTGPCYGYGGCSYGTVFKVNPAGQMTVLYSFTLGLDGGYPEAGLIQDAEGNLYGTTMGGGNPNYCTGQRSFAHRPGEWPTNGCGTVFELSPSGQEAVLYSFIGNSDGAAPVASLVRDTHGNLYGTTMGGGDLNVCYNNSPGCGTVFKVTWNGAETILHRFAGGSDGAYPNSALVRTARGDLIGTTSYAGPYGNGMVFKVSPAGKESILYAFTGGADGAYPDGALIQDSKGNLYGATGAGGAYGYGTIFKLTVAGKETVLYSFTGGADGSDPNGALTREKNGVIYGTAGGGGDLNCNPPSGCGIVFKLIP